MKPFVLIPAVALALYAFSSAHAAMSTVPYLGPNPGAQSNTEPNRLSGSNRGNNDWGNNNWGSRLSPLDPYLSLVPGPLPSTPEKRDTGPGFLNADPFDPNSVVNSYERSLYANPYPYDPNYNPYGQGASPYAPRGGATVPMGNGVPYRR
jgi:hypothetical protein